MTKSKKDAPWRHHDYHDEENDDDHDDIPTPDQKGRRFTFINALRSREVLREAPLRELEDEGKERRMGMRKEDEKTAGRKEERVARRVPEGERMVERNGMEERP